MSAAEVIELIKKLPPDEKAAVVAYLNTQPGVGETTAQYTSSGEAEPRKLRTIPQEDAERIADQIFDRHPELFTKLAQ
jgi:hypothetical protein